MAKMLVAITAIAIVVSGGSVSANSEKYDKSVAAAAAKIAAERLGTTRGSIDFNEKPGLVSHRDGEKQTPVERDQSLIWIPPEPEPDGLERISDAAGSGIDHTLTGSTRRGGAQPTRRTYWEWFDGDGNPVDPPY